MKPKNNKSIWIWALVILVVMNIAALGTILYNRQQSAIPLQGPLNVQGLDESAAMKYSGRYFRDNLGFRDEQMEEFVKINPGFRQQVQTINADLNRKRLEMLKEMSANNSDTAMLNQLSDSIGDLHASLKKVSYEYYLDIKNICDEEQREKLELVFSEMFSGEETMAGQGRGRQGQGRGNQFGRKFNN